MSPDLESYYSIDQWSVIEDTLVVRFLPDFLSTELVDPVVTVTVFGPLNIQDAESGLEARLTEMIVDLQASSNVFEVWAEYDDTPLSIGGREVRFNRSPYSQQDLVRAVERLRSELDSFQAASSRLRMHLHEVEVFVEDLLQRAQAKNTMTSRSTAASDAQIDALSRVLSRLRDD